MCRYYDPVRSFVIGSGMLAFYGAFGATLIILISLYCNKNSYPLNAYLLAAFTFFESWLIGTICAMYQQQGLECAAQIMKSTLYIVTLSIVDKPGR
jgi:FtsH-binding integral membrane protein